MWPYFTVPLEGHIRQVLLYKHVCDKYKQTNNCVYEKKTKAKKGQT